MVRASNVTRLGIARHSRRLLFAVLFLVAVGSSFSRWDVVSGFSRTLHAIMFDAGSDFTRILHTASEIPAKSDATNDQSGTNDDGTWQATSRAVTTSGSLWHARERHALHAATVPMTVRGSSSERHRDRVALNGPHGLSSPHSIPLLI